MIISSYDFRWAAKESLVRARQEMADGSDTRLRYAALELRYTMEALVYDRALAFKDDIPPDQYKTWQPRKLVALLLQIDPTIDFAATISIGLQPDVNTPARPEAMKMMGTDTPLSLKDLKDHYDALGSYLHMPSLGQLMEGNAPDIAKLRERCGIIVGIIDKVLSSPIWNATFGNYATLPECVNTDCKQPIKRRLPLDNTEIETRCFACGLDYTIKYGAGDHKVEWMPKTEPINCVNRACDSVMHLFPHEVKNGMRWNCRKCGTKNGIALSLVEAEPPRRRSRARRIPIATLIARRRKVPRH